MVGHVLVLTEYAATHRGEHLWWRRWEPNREYAQPLVQMLDGTQSDQPLPDEDFDGELEHWSRSKFPFLGESLDMVWLTREESLRLVPKVFGVSYCFGHDDRVIWSFTGNSAE